MNDQAVPNIDQKTVDGFGEEWAYFTQADVTEAEITEHFDKYFAVFPWDRLPEDAEGFDLGCGSGRWAKRIAPRVAKLHCIDPSAKALEVAKFNLQHLNNVEFHNFGVDDIPLRDKSMDFGVSLGVLDHIPDTAAGLASCVKKLKPGAPFLVYLYYALDNRPLWYRLLWRITDFFRKVISSLPFSLKTVATNVIAAMVYYPLARLALLFEKLGFDVDGMPLSLYRNRSFYSMRTDSLDRFGSRLEHRFTKQQVREMMEGSGLENIEFGSGPPFWCAVGFMGSRPALKV